MMIKIDRVVRGKGRNAKMIGIVSYVFSSYC